MTATQGDRFTITEASRLGDKLFWPAFWVNAFFILLHRVVLEVDGWQVIAVYSVNFAVAVFAVLPWAIRRATRSEFPRFHLVVRRPDIQQENRELAYRESLKLSTLAGFGTAGIAVLPMQWGSLSRNTRWSIEFLVWLAIFLGGSTGMGVLLLRNPFSGFSVGVLREVAEPPVEP